MCIFVYRFITVCRHSKQGGEIDSSGQKGICIKYCFASDLDEAMPIKINPPLFKFHTKAAAYFTLQNIRKKSYNIF